MARHKSRARALVDQMEEPKIVRGNHDDTKPSIKEVLEFRKAVRHLEDPYPFSFNFGLANTRENCAQSSKEVYRKLLRHTPEEDVLPFDTLGILVRHGNEVDESQAKTLVKVFQCDLSGYVSETDSETDFIQGCDNVYKQLRLLYAALKNSQRLDYVLENIINCIFFTILTFVLLSVVGIDPFSVLLSFTTIFLSFTFAFGATAAKYTEGIVLIATVALADPNSPSDPSGTATWFVEDLNLFFTTLRYAATNEIATVSNSALANARIINCARSKGASIIYPLKFGIATENRTIEIFKTTVEKYVNDRPSKWEEFSAMRCGRIEPDLGFVEYTLIVKHQKGWQDTGPIMDDKAELVTFCLEVAKSLGMRYEAPPMPVHLNMAGPPMSMNVQQQPTTTAGAPQMPIPSRNKSEGTSAANVIARWNAAASAASTTGKFGPH
eukprot:CAMPEP_0116027486 /NCGR_PEP_ID=MMETSP0321-20121206/14680_1 /TAXON_ID=163516 /ORGANISM="Leptocylindrus danicus var. danicus, Strain B650" /LENGTH=437 /DNA_ID=CAMNT_0003500895 /DNA_START=56 /DNA_END=1371 /DNA_ORIENTATION=+